MLRVERKVRIFGQKVKISAEKMAKGTVLAFVTIAMNTVSATAMQQQAPPALVEIAEASSELMAPQTFMPGTVISKNDSRIAAEITGQVAWVAPEGALVKQGDIIAKIDERNLNLAVERNRSQLKRLDARLVFLRGDLSRIRELTETNNTPISRAEEAESTLLMTEEERTQARIALERSEIDLERTQVKAPFPGRVVERLAQAGEYATPGRQILRLVDTENLEVSAQAPVSLAAVLADGQAVTIRKGAAFHDSSIRALVPVGDTVSRTMEIRVDVPKNTSYVVGTAVQIGVPESAPTQVVAVPRDALVLRSDGIYVFRITADNTAERLQVITGAAAGERVAVTGGVESGDRVVIRGGERLRAGQSVQLGSVVT